MGNDRIYPRHGQHHAIFRVLAEALMGVLSIM